MTPEEIEQSTSKMYQASEIYRTRKDILREHFYTQTCPFTPTIANKDTPKIENFYYRLQDWIDKRNKNTMKKTNDASFDRRTGQRFFSPKLFNNRFGKNVRVVVIQLEPNRNYK